MDRLHEDIRCRALSARLSGGQGKIVCPACASQRRPEHRREALMSVKLDGAAILYHCWHCSVRGVVPAAAGDKKTMTKSPPARPQPLSDQPTAATDEALDWLETERRIPRDIARRVHLVSANRHIKKLAGIHPCIGFAYQDDGKTYAVKWRSYPAKGFTQDGAAQTLYLADTVEPGGDLVICEGELDALSFHAAGIPAVSIPSGGLEADTHDDSARLRWISHHDDLLSKARRIYLAVDDDTIGSSTAQELARRLGKARCWRVSYPVGAKDANDTLVLHGTDAVRQLTATATPWPVEGIRSVNEIAERVMQLYEKGLPPGLATGYGPEVDQLFTVAPGNLVIVTGTPGSGKSAFLDDMLVRMMIRHKFKVGYCSFENPVDVHLTKLAAALAAGALRPQQAGADVGSLGAGGLAWLNDRCAFLDMDETPTPQGVFDRLDALVSSHGHQLRRHRPVQLPPSRRRCRYGSASTASWPMPKSSPGHGKSYCSSLRIQPSLSACQTIGFPRVTASPDATPLTPMS